jgi:hypothetical protein
VCTCLSCRIPTTTAFTRFYPSPCLETAAHTVWLAATCLVKAPSPTFEIMQAHAFEYIPADLKKSSQMQDEQITAEGQINYSAFARAIARISYCTAVSYLGLDGFDHMDLPALILGKYPYIPRYVGVMRNDPELPEPHGSMHRIDIQEYTHAGKGYWLVSLRLFSHSSFQDIGMPIYRTIVGRPNA